MLVYSPSTVTVEPVIVTPVPAGAASAGARACTAAGIIFVGPSPELLDSMGDKTAARHQAIAAGVPVLPGTENPIANPEEAVRTAAEIGFPLIIKAAFGGGGRDTRWRGSSDIDRHG